METSELQPWLIPESKVIALDKPRLNVVSPPKGCFFP